MWVASPSPAKKEHLPGSQHSPALAGGRPPGSHPLPHSGWPAGPQPGFLVSFLWFSRLFDGSMGEGQREDVIFTNVTEHFE